MTILGTRRCFQLKETMRLFAFVASFVLSGVLSQSTFQFYDSLTYRRDPEWGGNSTFLHLRTNWTQRHVENVMLLMSPRNGPPQVGDIYYEIWIGHMYGNAYRVRRYRIDQVNETHLATYMSEINSFSSIDGDPHMFQGRNSFWVLSEPGKFTIGRGLFPSRNDDDKILVFSEPSSQSNFLALSACLGAWGGTVTFENVRVFSDWSGLYVPSLPVSSQSYSYGTPHPIPRPRRFWLNFEVEAPANTLNYKVKFFLNAGSTTQRNVGYEFELTFTNKRLTTLTSYTISNGNAYNKITRNVPSTYQFPSTLKFWMWYNGETTNGRGLFVIGHTDFDPITAPFLFQRTGALPVPFDATSNVLMLVDGNSAYANIDVNSIGVTATEAVTLRNLDFGKFVEDRVPNGKVSCPWPKTIDEGSVVNPIDNGLFSLTDVPPYLTRANYSIRFTSTFAASSKYSGQIKVGDEWIYADAKWFSFADIDAGNVRWTVPTNYSSSNGRSSNFGDIRLYYQWQHPYGRVAYLSCAYRIRETINQAPFMQYLAWNPETYTFAANQTDVIFSPTELNAFDPDHGSAQIRYYLVSSTLPGRLEKLDPSTNIWSTLTVPEYGFSQSDIEKGLVRFVLNDGATRGLYTLTFYLVDDAIARSPNYNLTIRVTADENFPPVVKQPVEVFVRSGSVGVITSSSLSITDRETTSAALRVSFKLDHILSSQGFMSIKSNSGFERHLESNEEISYGVIQNNSLSFHAKKGFSTNPAQPIVIEGKVKDPVTNVIVPFSLNLNILEVEFPPESVMLGPVQIEQGIATTFLSQRLLFESQFYDASKIMYSVKQVDKPNVVSFEKLTPTGWIESSQFTQLEVNENRVRLSFDTSFSGNVGFVLDVGTVNAFLKAADPTNFQDTLPVIPDDAIKPYTLNVIVVKRYQAPQLQIGASLTLNENSRLKFGRAALTVNAADIPDDKIFIKVLSQLSPAEGKLLLHNNVTGALQTIGANSIIGLKSWYDGEAVFEPTQYFHGVVLLSLKVYFIDPMDVFKGELSSEGILTLTVVNVNYPPTITRTQIATGQQSFPIIINKDTIDVSDVDGTLPGSLRWYLLSQHLGYLQFQPANSDWQNETIAGGNITHSMVYSQQIRFQPINSTFNGWANMTVRICDPEDGCVDASLQFNFNPAPESIIGVGTKSGEPLVIILSTVGSVAVVGAAGLAYSRYSKKKENQTMDLVVTSQKNQTMDIQLALRLFAEGFVTMKKELTSIRKEVKGVKEITESSKNMIESGTVLESAVSLPRQPLTFSDDQESLGRFAYPSANRAKSNFFHDFNTLKDPMTTSPSMMQNYVDELDQIQSVLYQHSEIPDPSTFATVENPQEMYELGYGSRPTSSLKSPTEGQDGTNN